MVKYLESNLNFPQQLVDFSLKNNQVANQREFFLVDYQRLLVKALRAEKKAQYLLLIILRDPMNFRVSVLSENLL